MSRALVGKASLGRGRSGGSLALLSLLAGCAFSPSKGPPRAGAHQSPELRAASHSARLGWLTWSNPTTILYCNRRIDDQGNPVGVTGPCSRLEAGEQTPHRIVDWTNAGRPDSTAPTAGPWDRCSIELEDAQLVPTPKPARAFVVSPTGKTLIEEWTPDPKINGDVFALEVSFSPEGKWMAVARLAIGLGEGERTIEVSGVNIWPVPACR
jgi:hypothetical protein